MNMIERVARALAAEHYCDRYKKPVENAHVQINVDANWIDYASTARAAIEAMIDPTEKMIFEGDAEPTSHSWGYSHKSPHPDSAEFAYSKPIYQAMIEAALEEK